MTITIKPGKDAKRLTEAIEKLKEKPSSKAVSYTHLDVYKRQKQASIA